MYEIEPNTYKVAEILNVKIKPSRKKNKKIDVMLPNSDKIVSIGDTRYMDFHKYEKQFGLPYALKKKENYYKRHGTTFKGIKDFYAKMLLW